MRRGRREIEALRAEVRELRERVEIAERGLRHLSTYATEDVCEHADRPHTVWWMLDDDDSFPIPMSASFDNRDDAVKGAQGLVANPRLLWAKVFRTDNENYTCWRWSESSGGEC